MREDGKDARSFSLAKMLVKGALAGGVRSERGYGIHLARTEQSVLICC